MPKDEENDVAAAVERLAARLRELYERYDPGESPGMAWADLPDQERRLYRALVRDMVRFECDIKSAQLLYKSIPATTK